MIEQLDMHGTPGVKVDNDRARANEMDCTPIPLIRQILPQLQETIGRAPQVLLDTHAGAGAFGMVCGEIWPKCVRFGIEIREEEEANLRNNYERHSIDDFTKVLETPRRLCGLREVDLVITNPAFSDAYDLVEKLMQSKVMNPGAHIVLLQLNEFGQRSERGADVFSKFPPWAQARIPGSIKFRTGINPANGKKWAADLRSYSWWIWKAGVNRDEERGWAARNLPRLPAEDRQWKIRPGEEWRYQ